MLINEDKWKGYYYYAVFSDSYFEIVAVRETIFKEIISVGVIQL